MKRLSAFLAVIFFSTPLLIAQAVPAQAAPPSDSVVEEIIARVNNSIITRADMRHAREQLLAELRQDNPATADQDAKEHEKDMLRDLIDQQLLLQKAQDLGISADADLVKRLDDLRKQMHADSMEDMEKAAQAQGISWEDFKQNMKNNITTQKVISQEVGGHITVSNQEVQQYYDQHKGDMDRPEQVRLSEILISTQKPADQVKTEKGETALPEAPSPEMVAAAQAKANQIYEMLKKGAKFDDLAKQYSNGPTSAVGGDLEYFKRGTLSKQLEEQVFQLQAGQFTEPIRTNQGFVILKVTEHQQSGVPALKDVESQIQEQIYMTKMQPALRDYLTKLREEAYIDIKPGYIDTGASPNETQPIFTTASSDSGKPAKDKKKKKLGLF